jgi:hypothetical protein
MLPYSCEDAHKVRGKLMQIALLVIAGFIALTAVCFAALMSLAGRLRRRDEAGRPAGRVRT